MCRKLLVFVFYLTTLTCSAQEVNVSNYQFWDTEPYLAVNPKNSNHLVSAWMKATANHINVATKTSYDGGKTWGSQNIITHISPTYTSADVSIAFNSKGEVFLSYIDYKLTLDSGAVYVIKSSNGGNSWSAPIRVIDLKDKSDLPIDRPWIAIDNSGGTRDGYLYVTSKTPSDVACPCGTYIKTSTDNGLSWSPLKNVDAGIPMGPMVNGMSVPTVGADGALYAMYPSYNTNFSPYSRWIVAKSVDGGNNFTYTAIGNSTGVSANNDTLLQSGYTLSANPIDKNNLIASWTDHRNGDLDIFSSYSMDGGASWSTPIPINDDVMSGNEQDMSWTSFSSDGLFACVWRDRRNTGKTSDKGFETFYSTSSDKGVSFKPNKKLGTGSPIIKIQKGNDFQGVAVGNKHIYNNWSDLRTGNTEIFFTKDSLVISDIKPNENEEIQILEVFPNPTHDIFNVVCVLKSKQNVKLELLDISGNQVLSIIDDFLAAGRHTFVVKEPLIKGIYLVRLKTPQQDISKRIEKY